MTDTDGTPRSADDDRIPRPVVYRPLPGAYTGPQPVKFLALTSRNGPAKASLILIAVSLVGAGVLLWLPGHVDRGLLAVVSTLTTAAMIMAFLLAIAGLVLAAQRPTKKRESVFALVVSSLLVIGSVAVTLVRALGPA